MTTRALKYPDLPEISHKHTLDELAEIYGVSVASMRNACQRRDLMYLPTEYEKKRAEKRKMRRVMPENELAAASLRLAIATVDYKVKYHGPHWIPVLRRLLGEAACS